ncbi:DNA alkylation repair protein [Gilvimarinus sp. DA14]|nr:DNA alkylation repair protein [Gilvimarinus sp. DA14]
MQRFFPHNIALLGVAAPQLRQVVRDFYSSHSHLNAEDVLQITELLLQNAKYNEEKLLAFSLLNKWTKKFYSDELLTKFRFWLENYANNWSLVDDLCLKTIYPFLLGRPYLIETIQPWSHSKVPWCRRASNVAWVKFIDRKIGRTHYQLRPELVFENCDTLLYDPHEYVQKSIGWLLKVTAQHHRRLTTDYLRRQGPKMPRSTLRYALEKLPDRKKLLTEIVAR